MENVIYADYNATTPLCRSAIEWMNLAFSAWGNPSSSHQNGRKARELLESARTEVAKSIGVRPEEIVFTSGGSEANTMAILGSLLSKVGFRLLTSGVEHSSVRDTAKLVESRGGEVKYLPLNSSGQLNLSDFELMLKEFRPTLVSLMTANNETGILFPIPELYNICKEKGIAFHTDGVQAFGKIPSDYFNGPDFISISAHKIYGPKGVGALIVKKGYPLIPIHYGGSQETKRRGGTENIIGIAGFAGACSELPGPSIHQRLREVRDYFEKELLRLIPDTIFIGQNENRIPNTSNLRFPGISSDVLLSCLDVDGICISAGSACSSGSIKPSHVLLEMGLTSEQAKECMRFSFGKGTTPSEVDQIVSSLTTHVYRIRARRGK